MEQKQLRSEDYAPLATEIAGLMGCVIERQSEQPGAHDYFAILRHPDGWGLSLYGDAYGGNRWDVSGQYPKEDDHTMPVMPRDTKKYWGIASPTIGVSALKSPEKVVADIKRRLLPEYMPMWQECVETVAVRNKYRRDKQNMAEMISRSDPALRVSKDGYGRVQPILHGHVGDSYINIRTDAHTVKLEVDNVPPDLAIDFIERLRLIKGGTSESN